jgi:uncharacterized protein (DUF2141 family)
MFVLCCRMALYSFIKYFFIAIGLLFSGAAAAQTASGTMAITISNAQRGTSLIRVGLYNKASDFPDQDKVYWAAEYKPSVTGSTKISIPNLPVGTYAVAIYQDLNGNKDLDVNFVGYPKEPFGFSKNFKPKIGAPSFSDCSIAVRQSSVTSFSIKLLR